MMIKTKIYKDYDSFSKRKDKDKDMNGVSNEIVTVAKSAKIAAIVFVARI